MVLRIGESCHKRAGTLDLIGRLTVHSRVGEVFIVEDPVSVQSLDGGTKTAKVPICHCSFFWSDIESAKRLDLEVAARPSIIEVGSELRAIDAQLKFFFTAMVLVTMEDVVESKGISQEYPSPPEINAELEVGLRSDLQSLSLAVACSTEMDILHPCAMFEHERQVILIG